MNKNEAKINKWFANFEHRFNTAVPKIVAETAIEFFQDSFKNQGWDGVPWATSAPLNEKYAKSKTRGKGKILVASTNLSKSFSSTMVSPGRIRISAGNAKAPYAKVHNEGLRVRGVRYVRAFHNNNFMGTGKRVQIKQHTRKVDFKMPRRQFMGHSRYLNEKLIDRLTKAFNN